MQELFRVFQQVFDEVIERLPVFGPLLAQVKVETGLVDLTNH